MALTYDRISEIAQQEGMNPDDAISLFSETDLGDSKVSDKDIQFVIRNAQKESHRTNDQRVRQYKSLPDREEEAQDNNEVVAASPKGVTIEKRGFLNDLFSQSQQASNEMRSAVDAQRISMDQTISEYNRDAAALVAAQGGLGSDTARMWTATAAIDAKHALDVAKTTSALGINTDDIDSMVATVMERRLVNSQKLTDLNAAVSQAQQSVPTFLQNPIGNIIGNIQLQPLIQQHNAVLRELNEDGDILNSQTKIAENLETSNLGKLGAIKAAQSLAHADMAVSSAKISQQETKMTVAKMNMAFASKEIEAAKLSQESIDRQLRIAITMQESQDRDEARQARADVLALKQQQEASALASKNIVAGILGRVPYSSLAEYNKEPIQRKLAFEQILASGGNTLGADANGESNPLDAKKNVQLLGNPAQMSDELKTMYTYVNSFDHLADSEQRGLGADPKYKEKMMLATKASDKKELRSQFITDQFNNMQANTAYQPDPKLPNIYHAPPVNYMLNDPTIIKTALGGILGDVSKISPNTAISDGMILGLVKDKLQDGTYPGGFEQAAKDVETYYKVAMQKTNAAYKFSAWGVPEQTVYMIDHKNMADYRYVIKELLKITAPIPGIPGMESSMFQPYQAVQ